MSSVALLILGPVLLGLTTADPVMPGVGTKICIKGYIMDFYCITLGVLFDNRNIPTLSADGPTSHSVHCLIDVPQCIASPYEVLNLLDDGTSYGRAWRLESNDEIVAHAHEFGSCSGCQQNTKGDGFIEKGFRATLNATVTEIGSGNMPTKIVVTQVNAYEDFETICGTEEFVVPNMVTSSGGLMTKIYVHGSLMLIGWGFLLPSGAIIAK